MKKHNKNWSMWMLFCLVLSIVHIHRSYCMSYQSMTIPQVDMHDIESMKDITMSIELNMRAFMAAMQLGDNGPRENEDIDEWCQKWVEHVFSQIDAYSPHDDKRKQSEERALQRVREKILTRRSQKYKVLSFEKRRLHDDNGSEAIEISKIIWRHKTITAMSVGIVIIAGIAYGIWKYKNEKKRNSLGQHAY